MGIEAEMPEITVLVGECWIDRGVINIENSLVGVATIVTANTIAQGIGYS